MEIMRSLIASCVLVLVGCVPQTANPPTGISFEPPPSVAAPTATAAPLLFTMAKGAKQIGACAATVVYDREADPEAFPETLSKASGNSVPRTPYAFAHPPSIAGFLFDYPPRPGTSAAYNKILWIVGTARTGPLEIDGHPYGSVMPTVHYSVAMDPNYRGSGEVYGSQIKVPSAGCWQFTLTWAGQRAEIELDFVGAP
jgi:hypothetical protein